MKTGVIKIDDTIIILNNSLSIEENVCLYDDETKDKVTYYELKDGHKYSAKKEYNIKQNYTNIKTFENKKEAELYLEKIYEEVSNCIKFIEDINPCCCTLERR